MDEVDYFHGGVDLLGAVRPMWEQLNRLHAGLSEHFGALFAERTFADRKAALIEKARRGALRVDIARRRGGDGVGYCIGTMDTARMGEIDSVFVDAPHRHRGIGTRLLRASLDWMEELGARTKRVVVAGGNEKVFAFYAQFGFRLKNFELALPPPGRLAPRATRGARMPSSLLSRP